MVEGFHMKKQIKISNFSNICTSSSCFPYFAKSFHSIKLKISHILNFTTNETYGKFQLFAIAGSKAIEL
jgi:hypothetical protein